MQQIKKCQPYFIKVKFDLVFCRDTWDFRISDLKNMDIYQDKNQSVFRFYDVYHAYHLLFCKYFS